MANGKFITVEGLDGAGKSRVIEIICSVLDEFGLDYLSTREPGGTALGESIRETLLSPNNQICADAEILLLFAARAQHLENVILPKVKEGIWVVCDRFTDSTYAYQGGGRTKGFESIHQLEMWVQGDFRPDITLYLDTDITTGQQRVEQSGEPDRIESEDFDYHRRVQIAYKELAESHNDRIKIVDAIPAFEEVSRKVRAHIEEFLKNHGYRSS